MAKMDAATRGSKANSRPKVWFSAGEASGDLYAWALGQEILMRFPNVEIGGLGGNRLAEIANQPLIKNTSDWGSISISQSVREGVRAIGTYRRTVGLLQRTEPGVFVPIDFGFMNLRLAAIAKAAGWRVIYFVPPASWRKDRQGKDVPNVCHHVVTPFPWSAQMLNQMGANAHFFGHPLKEIHRQSLESAVERSGTAILLGSRKSEIEQHLPILKQIGEGQKRLVPIQKRWLERVERQFMMPEDEVVNSSEPGTVFRALRGADRALVCSGTATLEAAIAKTPMVAYYRVSRITEIETKIIGWKRPEFVSQPNILLGRAAVPELIQEDCTVERIVGAWEQLSDPGIRKRQLEAFEEIDSLLGEPYGISKTVDLICEELRQTPGARI